MVYPLPGRDGMQIKVARYAAGAVCTVAYLVKERPNAIIVTNPPVFPALISYAYGKVTGAPVIIDGHPSSFGLKGNRYGQLMLPITRWLTPRVAATLVTGAGLGSIVQGWGGRAAVTHEAPPLTMPTEYHEPDTKTVFFACIFSSDEPVAEVLGAARLRPDVLFQITGDTARAERFITQAPENVKFLGFLGLDQYAAALADAAVVMSLTDEPTSVVRAGYEAVYALKPLIVSDTPALRAAFPGAEYVAHTPDSLAEAVDRLLGESQAEQVLEAREFQMAQWTQQLAELESLASEAAP